MTTCSSRALLSVLAERGPIDVGSLSAHLEVHPVTVTQQCTELQSAGYVRQVTGGVYVITDDGDEYLAQLADPPQD